MADPADGAAETKRFDLVFEGHGRATGKMRNDITVDFATMNERYELATDEGPFHGGDASAPPPLALFTAALTGCLMTQIRAFAKRLKIEIDGLDVKTRLHWEGEQVGRGPYESAPVAFTLDVDIQSDAPADDLKRLLAAAKKGCFIETTLKKGIDVGHRLKIGDEWIDA